MQQLRLRTVRWFLMVTRHVEPINGAHRGHCFSVYINGQTLHCIDLC